MSTSLLILNLTPRNKIWYRYISFCGQPGFQPAIRLIFWRKTAWVSLEIRISTLTIQSVILFVFWAQFPKYSKKTTTCFKPATRNTMMMKTKFKKHFFFETRSVHNKLMPILLNCVMTSLFISSLFAFLWHKIDFVYLFYCLAQMRKMWSC